MRPARPPVLSFEIDTMVSRIVRSVELQEDQYLNTMAVVDHLADLLEVEDREIYVASHDIPNEPIHEMAHLPAGQYLVKRRQGIVTCENINISVFIGDDSFDLQVSADAPHSVFESKVARVVGVMPEFLAVRGRDGLPWTFPLSAHRTRRVQLDIHVARAGMPKRASEKRSRSRSQPQPSQQQQTHEVSPTEPFQESLQDQLEPEGHGGHASSSEVMVVSDEDYDKNEGDDNDDNQSSVEGRLHESLAVHENIQDNLGPEQIISLPRVGEDGSIEMIPVSFGTSQGSHGVSGVRTAMGHSSRRHDDDGDDSVHRHIQSAHSDRSSPYRIPDSPDAFRSSVLLRTPPDAQPPTCARPVVDADGFVGTIRAPEAAEVQEVLEDLRQRLKPLHPITVTPVNITQWREVDQVFFPEKTDSGISPYVDLRTKWEKYQDIRYLPIIYAGVVKVHMVAPIGASLLEIQGRVWAWSNWTHTANITALGHDSWVVHMGRLPDKIVELVRSSDVYQTMGDHAINRGGALLVCQGVHGGAPFIPRGGGKRNYNGINPKQAMIGWALDRIREEAPEIKLKTAEMILKAEPRTVSAVLHCKDATQLRHSMRAAFRRADLEDMEESRQSASSSSTSVLDELKTLAEKNAESLERLKNVTAQMPTKEELRVVLEQIHIQGIANCQALHLLTESVQRIDDRVKSWETNFLPEMLDRLPPPMLPQTPDSAHGDEVPDAQMSTQPYDSVNDESLGLPDVNSSQPARSSSEEPVSSVLRNVPAPMPVDASGQVLHRIQHKSLSVQSRRALAPFRAAQ